MTAGLICAGVGLACRELTEPTPARAADPPAKPVGPPAVKDAIRKSLSPNGRRGKQWQDHRAVIDGIL